jgi:MFS family permease
MRRAVFPFRLPAELPPEARATYRLDLVSNVLRGLFFGIFLLAGIIAKKALGASHLEVGLIAALPSASALFSVYWGHLAHNRRKRPFILWPGVIGRGLLVLTPFVSTSGSFVLLASLSFVLASVSVPAQNGIYRLIYPQALRGAVVGKIRAGFLAGSISAAMASGVLLDHDASLFRVLMPIAGLLGALSSIVFALIRFPDGEPPTKLPSGWNRTGLKGLASFRWLSFLSGYPFYLSSIPARLAAPLRGTLTILREDKPFARYLLCYFLHGSGNLLMLAINPIFFVETLHLDYSRGASALVAIPELLMLLTSGFWGRKLDRMSPYRLNGILTTILAGAPLALFFASSPAWAYGGQVFYGLSMSGLNLTWILGVLYFASETAVPVYLGIHITLTGIRGLLAPLVAIALYETLGPRAVYAASFALIAISGILNRVYARLDPREETG